MGLIGGALGQGVGAEAGNLLGQGIGGLFGGKKGAGIGGRILGGVGRAIGGIGGALLPFEKGGIVKTKKGKKTQPALLHQGEMVIPKKHVKSVPASLKKKIKKEGGRNM